MADMADIVAFRSTEAVDQVDLYVRMIQAVIRDSDAGMVAAIHVAVTVLAAMSLDEVDQLATLDKLLSLMRHEAAELMSRPEVQDA